MSYQTSSAVLYDYMEMEYLLCHSCWTEEKPVRIDEDTIKIYRPKQLRAIRVKCLNCNAFVTEQKKCARCFPEH